MARTDTFGSPGSSVTSVSNLDGTLVISPNVGAVIASVDLTHNFNWTGQHTFNSFLPTSSLTPTQPNELVTKLYTDTFALGLQLRPSCLAATTAALPANVYNNGALGVGATLTAVLPGVLTIDGVSPGLNDRVLVKNEVAQANNGIYTLTTVGTGGIAYILTRAIDYDQTAEVTLGTFTPITMGTANGNTIWAMDNPAAITMGTTAITFSQLSTTFSNMTIGNPVIGANPYAILLTDGASDLYEDVAHFTYRFDMYNYQQVITAAGDTATLDMSGSGNIFDFQANTGEQSSYYADSGGTYFSFTDGLGFGATIGITNALPPAMDFAMFLHGGGNDGYYLNSTVRIDNEAPIYAIKTTGTNYGLLDFSLMATSDKTFTFPNRTEVVALETGNSRLTVASPTGGGLGYETGAGGSVIQLVSKATAVTLNKICGRITMNAANLANNATVSFALNNTTIGATDVPYVFMSGVGTIGGYRVQVTRRVVGNCSITVTNQSGGPLAQAIVLDFIIFKSVIV